MRKIYVGPGSCQGDSGGPLYKKVHDQGKLRLILLGVTSKGHSKIGNCGGIDNPTHYVRLREMLSWITKYVKKRKEQFVIPTNSVISYFKLAKFVIVQKCF